MEDTASAVTVLDEKECWEFLSTHSFGRLAYVIAGEPYIAPINYYAGGGRMLFRTAEGNKLFGVTVHDTVCFEVDDVEGDLASSVIVRGSARQLEGHEAEEADRKPLRPWVPTLKYIYVEISVQEITGRRFHLGPEPERY